MLRESAKSDEQSVRPIAKSDSTVFSRPIFGVDVFKPGTLSIRDTDGVVKTIEVLTCGGEDGRRPTRLVDSIAQVLKTGTTIDDRDMEGIETPTGTPDRIS